jgi:hypothetical protein
MDTTIGLWWSSAAQVKPWGSYKISGMSYNPLPNLNPDPVTGVVSCAVTAPEVTTKRELDLPSMCSALPIIPLTRLG